MMKKRLLLTLLVAGFSVVFVSASVYAGTKAPDVMKMEDAKAYKKHTKGIVTFTHKKHVEEYGAGCGDCHHDEKGKPLTNLKDGDDVQKCVDCHKPGKAKISKDQKAKLSKDEIEKLKLEYHYEAIHQNCKECHEKHNMETTGKKKGPAPYKPCSECHPKNK